MEDIFAYADDLLVLCYSLSELHQVINLIKDWSSLNNLKLNTLKSGILEVVPRRGKNNFNLAVGSKFQDFPVISSYKYLGVLINQKLSPETHLNWLKSRLIYLHNKLSPVLSQVSVNYCHNLWQLLVKPLLDPLAILGSLEVAQCWKEKVERLFKLSLKQFLNLGITTPNETLYYISGYNIHERGEILIQDATKRWEARKSHSKFVKSPLPQFKHRLKYAPKSFSRYVCMLNAMCPQCKDTRISAEHLQSIHQLPILTAEEICEDFCNRGEGLRKGPKSVRKKLLDIIAGFEEEILIYCKYLSEFLNNCGEIIVNAYSTISPFSNSIGNIYYSCLIHYFRSISCMPYAYLINK